MTSWGFVDVLTAVVRIVTALAFRDANRALRWKHHSVNPQLINSLGEDPVGTLETGADDHGAMYSFSTLRMCAPFNT